MNIKEINFMQNRYGLFVLYTCFLIVLLVFVTGVNGLGPLDDHHMLRTIFQGKDFGFYVMPELGRFFPLAAQEYVVLAKFFGASPILFYAFNAFKLIPCGFLLYQCLTTAKIGNLATFILWSVTILSIGIANTLFRLSAGELNSLICMLLIAWLLPMILEDNAPQNIKTNLIAIAGLCSFFIALFYKELTFIFGAAFGAAEWFRYFRAKKRHPPVFIYALVVISSAYIAGYVFWRLLYVTGSYASFHSSTMIDVLFEFAFSDPFLIFVVVPLTIYRLIVAIKYPAKHLIYDSFLFAACAYVAAYFALSIFNWYYLLPAYAFAVTGVAGILENLRHTNARRAMLFAITLCGLNVLPIAISDIQAQKKIINNHYQFVNFMANWLKADDHVTTQPRTLILVGVSPGSGVEIIVSLKTFLSSLGVREGSIEVRGSESSDNQAISQSNIIKAQLDYDTKPGDLLIFNPYQKRITPPPLQAPSSEEIYRSGEEWVFPRWSGWRWIAACMLDQSNCAANIDSSKRYSGYAALLVKRQTKIATPIELKLPKYRTTIVDMPLHMATATSQVMTILIENTGSETWPANGRLQAGKYVNLAYRWFDGSGRMVFEGDRVPFPEEIDPGDKVKVAIRIKTPMAPGTYHLVISPVQEEVQWFEKSIGETIEIYK